MKSHTTVLLVVLASSAAACALGPASDPETQQQSNALLNAPEAPGDLYEVGICGAALNQDPNLGPVGACLARRCNGTLVGRNLVLAGRGACVDVAQFPADGTFCDGTFTRTTPAMPKVTFSASMINGNPVWLDVAEIRYPETNRFCDDNLALLVLTDNVPPTVSRPIAIDVRRNVAQHPPSAFTFVGRGGIALHLDPVTDTISQDDGGATRRILQNISFMCASDVDQGCSVFDIGSPGNLFRSPKALLMAGPAVAFGDTGTAFLEQSSFDRHKPKAMGVTAAALTPFDANGDPSASIGVRTSVHRSFLIEGARAAAQRGHYRVPAWARDGDDGEPDDD
jgi:hypothetical protein